MNEKPGGPQSESLPLTLAGSIDRACDRYEAEWNAGVHPRIEAYLADATEPECPALLRELLLLELEFRRGAGERPAREEYVARFPQYNTVVDSVFAVTDGAVPTAKCEFESTRTLHPTAGAAKAVGAATSAGSRFRILRLHEQGGLGDIYVARDQELNRDVALKEIRGRFADHPHHRARFQFEAEITGGLEHPGIVPVYGLGHHEDGRPYYAMRFIKGDSLKSAVERFHKAGPHRDAGESRLELRKLLGRFLDVCDALDYAHSRGVLHRDLKPANVMLGKYGETLVVDWGLAKSLSAPELRPEAAEPLLSPSSASGLQPTVAGTTVGTPAYMSPEQAAGRLDELGVASDVYSLGATLFYLLTGESPVTGENHEEVCWKVIAGDVSTPRSIQPAVPRALEAICKKAMALEPKDRYPTPRALAQDIEHWLADEPVTVFQEPWNQRLGRWMRRHKSWVTGAAALLVTAFFALAISTAFVEKAREAEAAARKSADEARSAEALARQQAEGELYLSNVALAGREWREGNAARVEELLNECSPARRQWEWHYLKRQAESGSRTLVGPHFGTLTALAFNPDGKRIVSAGFYGTAKVWDVAEGRVILDLDGEHGHAGHVLGAAWSRDGKWIATAGFDKSVRVWDASSGARKFVLNGHSDQVTAVAFSTDGRLVSAGRDKLVKVWDLATGECSFTISDHAAAVTTVKFSPDGARIAAAGEIPDIGPRLWDARTGKAIRTFSGLSASVNSLAFRPDGRRLAAAGNDGVVLIWEVETGKETGRLSPARRSMLTSVEYSPDEKRLASGGLDQAVRIWDGATHRELFSLNGHASGVTSLAFSTDGVHLASGSEDGVIKIWDATRGTDSIRVPAEPNVRYSGLAFSPDGKWIASAVGALPDAAEAPGRAKDGTVVRLLKAADLKPGPILRGHEGDVSDIVFDPSGAQIAAAGKSGLVTVWEIASGRKLFTLSPKAEADGEPLDGCRLSFGPGAGNVTLADARGMVTVWETSGGREVSGFRAFDTPKREPGRRTESGGRRAEDEGKAEGSREFSPALAFDGEGRRLAVGGLKAIEVWDVATGKRVSTLHAGLAAAFAVAFSPDGRQLAAALLKEGGAASTNEIKIWDLSNGRELVTFKGAIGGTYAIAFTPDGRRLATTGYYHRDVMVWDAASGRELLALGIDDTRSLGGPGTHSRIAFSPDGTRLALVGLNGITSWVGTPATESLTLHCQVSVWGLAYSPDGRYLATADNHEAVTLRNRASGRVVRTLPEPGATRTTALIDLAFSPDSQRVAAAVATKSKGTLTVWNAATGEVEGQLEGHGTHVIDVEFSPDGRLLATASHDKTAKIWDAIALKELRTLAGHADRVNGVAFHPDGRQLATCCRDGTVKLWDSGTGRELASWLGHKGSIVSVAFSPDGRYLATGGGRRFAEREGPPGEIKIWDVGTHREVFNLPGVTHFIHSVAFSPDSRFLASGGEDRTVRVWEVASGRELATMGGHDDLIKRVAFSPDRRSVASCGEDRTVRVWDVSGVVVW